MNQEISLQLRRIKLYEETQNASLVCFISWPTLPFWRWLYKEPILDDLKGYSRRPANSPSQKGFHEQGRLILYLCKRGLGIRQIESDLLRDHQCMPSLATIHKVLKSNNQQPHKQIRLPRKKNRCYQRDVPGDPIQENTCKIAPRLYEYAAIDDCTWVRVLVIYSQRTAANSMLSFERVIEEMPIPSQRIQTDQRREFFAYVFQERVMGYCIKFWPNKPAPVHLNTKVERSQKADFWSTADLRSPDMEKELNEWQVYYNEFRPHGPMKGKPLGEQRDELQNKTPYQDEVEVLYDPAKERIQHQGYQVDLEPRKVKISV